MESKKPIMRKWNKKLFKGKSEQKIARGRKQTTAKEKANKLLKESGTLIRMWQFERI